MAQSSVISIKHSEYFRFVLILYLNSTVQEMLTALIIWGNRQYFGAQTTSGKIQIDRSPMTIDYMQT